VLTQFESKTKDPLQPPQKTKNKKPNNGKITTTPSGIPTPEMSPFYLLLFLLSPRLLSLSLS
jgi:hypothetical protein